MNHLPTQTQVSAGGITFRRRGSQIEVALISVGDEARWQLPKGLVNKGETTETAAQREVREETGIETELLELIDKIEYWYYSTQRGERIRFHKFVYFYLLRYLSGDVRDHDQEVNEARWFEIEEAGRLLAFKSERQLIARAAELIASFT